MRLPGDPLVTRHRFLLTVLAGRVARDARRRDDRQQCPDARSCCSSRPRPPVRQLVRRHLELAGFHLEETADGRAALDRLRGVPYDVIILDALTPTLDGLTLCRAARAGGPNVDAADPDGQRARQRVREGAGPLERCRRLHDQADRRPRAAGADRRDPAAGAACRQRPGPARARTAPARCRSTWRAARRSCAATAST